MLRIHETAIALLREVMLAIREIERSDPDLAGPMQRSVMSTPLNIAEGGEQVGKRRGSTTGSRSGRRERPGRR